MKKIDSLDELNKFFVSNEISLIPGWEEEFAPEDSTPDYYNPSFFGQPIPMLRFSTPFDFYDWLCENPFAFIRHQVAIIFALMRRFESTGELNFAFPSYGKPDLSSETEIHE